MKRGYRLLGNYHWPQAQVDLAMGVHPAVVAARMNVHVDAVLETADAQGWPVSFKAPPPEAILDAAERIFK